MSKSERPNHDTRMTVTVPCIRLGKRIILSKSHLKQWIDAEIGFEIQSTTTEDIENG